MYNILICDDERDIVAALKIYLELKEGENGPAVIFRNTSRSEIVQSPEELTERFVRGDASRSSEGSGLGLSIARSLAELQGGSLAVTTGAGAAAAFRTPTAE